MGSSRWVAAMAAACAIACAGATAGAAVTLRATATEKVVRAQRFELTDEEGKVRAVMALGPAGLKVLASTGECVDFAVPRGLETPEVSLFDTEGRLRVRIAVESDGSPALGLFDEEGEAVFQVPPRPGVQLAR